MPHGNKKKLVGRSRGAVDKVLDKLAQERTDKKKKLRLVRKGGKFPK